MNKHFTYFISFFKVRSFLVVLVLSMFSEHIFAQNCGFSNGDGCSNTDYANYGLYSNNDASTIEYDNVVGSTAAWAVRTPAGKWMITGSMMANDGVSNQPLTEINNINYPAIGTSKPLKIVIAGETTPQAILLTSDGLYAWGSTNRVISNTIKSTNNCSKLPPINGNSFSLPVGLTPQDVKVLTGISTALMLITCSGEIWMMAANDTYRTYNPTGSWGEWTRVTTEETSNPPLSGIIAARISSMGILALKNDGTLWAWGIIVYKGDGSTVLSYPQRAVKIISPSNSIKMIGTMYAPEGVSYIVLDKNGAVYTLGANAQGQLGTWDLIERKSWVQPSYGRSVGPKISNVKWVSSHGDLSGVQIITNRGSIYGWGFRNSGLYGYTTYINHYPPQIPGGLAEVEPFSAMALAGNNVLLFGCNPNYGYYGGVYANTVSFATSPLSVCGQDKLNNVCISSVPGVGTIECLKTQISPVPVSGSSSRVTLRIQLNITSSGSFPLSVSGSGLSLVDGFSSITASNTGLQYFDIPLNYDGTALGILNFTVGNAGSCTADLSQPSKQVITNVWKLNNCTSIIPGTISK